MKTGSPRRPGRSLASSGAPRHPALLSVSRLQSRFIPAVICAIAGAALFQFFGNANRGYIDTASLFYWWGFQWFNEGSETEHGLLILLLSMWLFWRNLQRARPTAPSHGDSPGAASVGPAAAAMVGALGLHALGFAAQQARLSILALLLFVWGVLRLAGGGRWGRAAVFPLGFLVFAIPVNVLDSAGFWLQTWVTRASAAIAHGAGIGVLRSGNQLFAPDGRYQYDVVAACSGVRSLVAMLALSLLLSYLTFHSARRHALVLLLSVPLVYLGNVSRITAIIFAAQWGGQKAGDVAHQIMGWGVFVIVLGGVYLAVRAMERWWPEREGGSRERVAGADESRPATEPAGEGSAAGAGRRPPAVIAVVVAAACVATGFFLHHLANAPARGLVGVKLAADGANPVELPSFIGTEWMGRATAVTEVERRILPPDTGYSRKLYIPLARPQNAVLLSIVLSGRDRSSIHRPELCLTGQGWTILDGGVRQFRPGAAADGPFGATVLRVEREVATPRGKERVPQLVVYWFIAGDGMVATHWQRLARDAWNRVVHARADRWAYVLMQTDARDGEAAALDRIQAVMDGTLGVVVQRR